MAILVGQLIEILQRYDRDREVTIHTLKGEPGVSPLSVIEERDKQYEQMAKK